MYQAGIYIISVLLSVYAISGLNLNSVFKKDHIWEARTFLVICALALGYLLASFILNFMEISKVF